MSSSFAEPRVTARSYLARNFPWLAAESFDTPTTTAPALAKSSAAAVNPCASAVQPVVSSFG